MATAFSASKFAAQPFPLNTISPTSQNKNKLNKLHPSEKAHYAARDPITALKKYLIENRLASEADLKAIDKKIDEVVEDAVEFADESPVPPRSQLLENVFADPKGFGIGPDDRYRCEDPKFTEGTAQV
uniref:Dehydrogenase E1 component domain-containing protein n=1 Tax=Gossypium raimondii TaxID=29730 RepID=A0A0D2REI2_GOSRA|nr:hypothetical protein B456_008G131200 [Gossypium raimondii]